MENMNIARWSDCNQMAVNGLKVKTIHLHVDESIMNILFLHEHRF